MSAFLGVGVIDSVLWYNSFTLIYADFEADLMFSPEELRQARVFACLDEAECARLAHGTSVITLKPAIRYQFKTGQRDWPKT